MKGDPDLGRRALTALGWNYAGSIARMFAQLLIQLVLARVLGPAAFGEATAAMIVIGVGWLFAEAGFGSALVQKAELSDRDVSYALGWVLIVSLAVGGAVTVAAAPIAVALGSPHLRPLIAMCGLLIPLQALSNVPVSLMQRALDMKRLQIIQSGGYVLAYGGVGIALATAGFGAWSLLIAFAAQTLFTLAGSYACVRHTLRPRLTGDSGLRRFGLAVCATNLANWAMENVDRMLVTRLWGPASLGAYAVAASLSRAPMGLLVSSVQTVAFSSASRIQADTERLARGYLAALSLSLLIVAPLFAFLALHAGLVIHLFYGQRWFDAAPLFAAFCVAMPFLATLAITGPLLRAVGAVRVELWVQLVMLALMVVSLWLLRDRPLREVAWLVPLITLARAALVYRALAARLLISWRRLFHAVLAGGGFALIAGAASWASAVLVGTALLAAIVSALGTVVCCLALLQLTRGRSMPPELRAALLQRAAGSRAVARVCVLLGLGGMR